MNEQEQLRAYAAAGGDREKDLQMLQQPGVVQAPNYSSANMGLGNIIEINPETGAYQAAPLPSNQSGYPIQSGGPGADAPLFNGSAMSLPPLNSSAGNSGEEYIDQSVSVDPRTYAGHDMTNPDQNAADRRSREIAQADFSDYSKKEMIKPKRLKASYDLGELQYAAENHTGAAAHAAITRMIQLRKRYESKKYDAALRKEPKQYVPSPILGVAGRYEPRVKPSLEEALQDPTFIQLNKRKAKK